MVRLGEMRRSPSHSAHSVALMTAFCALGIAAGCGKETFDLLPNGSLVVTGGGGSAAGTAPVSAGSSGGGGLGGAAATGGKPSGGTGGKAELGGFGGRITTLPGGGQGNPPCVGDGGASDNDPPSCSPSDPYCTPCVCNAQCFRPDARYCDPDLNRCVQCRKDFHCPAGEACNPNTWRCAKECGGGKDSCGGDNQHLLCSPDGVCVSCINNTDCAGYGVFNSCSSNVCVECSDDSKCASGLCIGGSCFRH